VLVIRLATLAIVVVVVNRVVFALFVAGQRLRRLHDAATTCGSGAAAAALQRLQVVGGHQTLQLDLVHLERQIEVVDVGRGCGGRGGQRGG